MRSNFTNPAFKLARAISRETNAQNRITRGNSSTAASVSTTGMALTQRAGSGTAEDPYRTEPVMFWDIDDWGALWGE